MVTKKKKTRKDKGISVQHKILKSEDSAGCGLYNDPENPPKKRAKKLKHTGFILRSHVQTEYKWKQLKNIYIYAESKLGGPQFKMTEHLKVKVTCARNHLRHC